MIGSMIAGRRALLVVGLLTLSGTCGALEPGGTARAVEVVDGDTLVLDDGRQVRLVGIQSPKLPLGRANFEAWPLAEESKGFLEQLTLDKTLTLSYGGRQVDRHGRALAHLHDEAGRWIQGEVLSQGMARVYSFRDNRALVAEMLEREREARQTGRGIWGDPYYRVRSPAETPKYIDSFQLIEGRVLQAAVVKGRAYLNFGADWRTDFTISISPRDRRGFEKDGIKAEDYAGRKVRVRGWLKSFNGPLVDATHPEQIELLDE